MTNHYKTLGLKNFASYEEVKTAYRKLSKRLHPDVNEGDKFFEERFVEIQEAYEVLSDSHKKTHYDKELERSLSANDAGLLVDDVDWGNQWNINQHKKKVAFYKPDFSRKTVVIIATVLFLFSIFIYLLSKDEEMLREAQSDEALKKHSFAVGFTINQVNTIQGHPTNKVFIDSIEIWYYDSSTVMFINGKVTQYKNKDGNLKVLPNRSD